MADPGKGPVGPEPPLFLDQTEAQRAERNFLRDPAPESLSQRLDVYDRSPPLLFEGSGSATENR